MKDIKKKIPLAKKPKPTRSPTDLCLLCRLRPATKLQSHIVTKFWVETMKGDGKFYRINSYKDELAEISYDSPKEDYLFCPECEARFSFVERYIANNFYHKFRKPEYDSEFPLQRNWNVINHEMDARTLENVNPGVFKLLIYSFIWRMSISNLAEFVNFKLPPEAEEKFRWVLDTFMQNSEKNNGAFYSQNHQKFIHFPIGITTTYEDKNAGGNMLAAFNADDDVGLFINEYIITLKLEWDPEIDRSPNWNADDHPINISLLTESEWKEVYAEMTRFMVQKRVDRMGATGIE